MLRVPGWLTSASDLVLPRACGGCGRDGTWWCARCARTLDGPVRTARLDDGDLRVAVVAPYRGPVGAALVAWKERGVVALTPPLADALARAVRAVAPDRFVLVPAPSRPDAIRRRGADVVASLAQAAAIGLDGSPPVVRALAHRRRVADQAGLDPELRALNLAGALRVRPPARTLLTGRAVVLVDDVLTTGATLAEGARTLRRACPGAGPVVAAAVAAAGPFGQLFPDGRTG